MIKSYIRSNRGYIKMDFNQIYILNPAYILKSDKKRAVLYNRSSDPIKEPNVNDFLGLVHPLLAILFSLFNGEINLDQVITEASNFLNTPKDEILKLVSSLLENSDEIHFHFDGKCSHFPKNFLIKLDEYQGTLKKTMIKDFFIPKRELDLDSWRLYYPLDILFMVNTICSTDCIYCYADRRKKMNLKIPFKRIKELIKEAKNLQMRSFDISGGEFLLYPDWYLLLQELIINGFDPYLSTKNPLSLETIKRLRDIGIKRIQISIDSIVNEELKKILNVSDDYYTQILETLNNLNNIGFKIYTNTQVSNLNDDSIPKLINYLLKLENIKRISVGAASYSFYNKMSYVKYRTNKQKLKKIENVINEYKNEIGNRVMINLSGYYNGDDYLINDQDSRSDKFNTRARCSANFYSMFLLPDGKVTICEELYWHPKFIIGNINKQSIEEVWNSERALGLYRLSKEIIREESSCKKCQDFDRCRQTKGVCWKEILYAYGYENWDYPDPKCPKAPKPNNIFYL